MRRVVQELMQLFHAIFEADYFSCSKWCDWQEAVIARAHPAAELWEDGSAGAWDRTRLDTSSRKKADEGRRCYCLWSVELL